MNAYGKERQAFGSPINSFGQVCAPQQLKYKGGYYQVSLFSAVVQHQSKTMLVFPGASPDYPSVIGTSCMIPQAVLRFQRGRG